MPRYDQARKTKVAVVVPCYQSARYLGETVASVRRQTLTDWRLLIVDDGSSDNPVVAVREALDADIRIRLIRQENRGVAAARNHGAMAVGPSDYILFLDADDVLEPTMLERLSHWLDTHPRSGAAYCSPRFIDERGTSVTIDWAPRLCPARFGVREIPSHESVTPFVSVFCLAGIVPSLMLMQRSAFDATGGWDESFGQHYEDTLLFLMLSLQSEIHHLPEPLVRHRRHSGQSTADRSKFACQEDKLYERFRDMSAFPPEQAEVVRDAWRFLERRLIPLRAVESAARTLRAGEPVTATRFLGGAMRIVGRSLVLGPGRARV